LGEILVEIGKVWMWVVR